MEELFNNETNLIYTPIIEFIKLKLSNDFISNNGHPINKTDNVSIVNINVDVDNSELRIKLIINRIEAQARVWVKMQSGAIGNKTLMLRLNKQLILSFNNEINEYQIENEDELDVVDVSY